MDTPAMTQSQASSPRLPGTWKLEQGRAVTLRPREDGVLKIAHGRIWLTFDGPHAGPLNDLGDRLLGAGEQVLVPAGARIVMESCDRHAPVYFTWDFCLQPQAVPAATQAVAQSWDDLVGAIGLGVRAGGRLAGALVRLAAGAVLPRPSGARLAA
jgi:hypothetical protein